MTADVGDAVRQRFFLVWRVRVCMVDGLPMAGGGGPLNGFGIVMVSVFVCMRHFVYVMCNCFDIPAK